VAATDACRRGDVLLPVPFSYDPENQIVWQQAIPGRSFAKLASSITNLPELAEEIGARLAALHGAQIDLPRGITLDVQVQDLIAKLRATTAAFPAYAARLHALGDTLLHAAAGFDAGLVTPIHASFKFSHIFQTPEGIAFIDLDGACLGDPAFDLGRFNAHLYRMMAKGRIPREVAVQAADALCASYARAARIPVPRRRIDWAAASHLVTSELYKMIKRAAEGPVRDLIEVAERLCGAEQVRNP
jgi:aminoglycoside phosphotransferase (APT) family kinase protein